MAEKYEPGSVGNRMITEFIAVGQESTVKDVLELLYKKGKRFKMIDYIYVTDDKKKLVGVISLSEIFNSTKNTKVNKIMKRELITISPEAEEEKAAHLALKHDLHAIPIVKKGELLGVIPAKKLMSILNRSLQKDILHFAGIHKSHLKFENTMEVPVPLSIVHRLPWLVIGLMGIIFTAGFINIFESILEKYLILAFFVPTIVYISNALGTQHQTLFVRDLAIIGKEFKFIKYFLRQMLIAIIIGLFLSGIAFFIISLFWKQFFISFIIALSMFAAIIFTSFTSLMITFTLNKFKQDPALGSGPFATIMSDATSIIIYFLIASSML